METKISKFTGTTEMEQALDRMVQATNDGFSGGRVTRHNLLSWITTYFERECFSDCRDQIRQDHFDQVAHLEALLKQAKIARKAGASSEEVSKILENRASAQKPAPLRRTRKTQVEDSPAT